MEIQLKGFPIGGTPGSGFDIGNRVDDEVIGWIDKTLFDSEQDFLQNQSQLVEHVVACFSKTVIVIARSNKDLKRKARGERRHCDELTSGDDNPVSRIKLLLDQVTKKAALLVQIVLFRRG